MDCNPLPPSKVYRWKPWDEKRFTDDSPQFCRLHTVVCLFSVHGSSMPILIILVGETPHRNSDPCRPGLLQNDATFSSAFWLQSSPRTSVMFLKDVPWGHKNHQTHPVGLEFSRQRMECLFVSRTCFVRYTTLITKCLFNIKWNLTHCSPTNIWDVNQPKVGLTHSHLGFDQPNWAETCKNDQKCGLNKATCFFQWQAWECLMEELTGTRDIASTVTFLEPWCPDPSTNLGLALMKCRSKWFNDFQGISMDNISSNSRDALPSWLTPSYWQAPSQYRFFEFPGSNGLISGQWLNPSKLWTMDEAFSSAKLDLHWCFDHFNF